MSGNVALTLGDPAGIGGEIALKAWREMRGQVPFFLIGDAGRMADLGAASEFRFSGSIRPMRPTPRFRGGFPCSTMPCPARVGRGNPQPENAAATIEIIARGAALAREGAALALCTNPINKKALKDGADFAFPGHTEFLAALAGASMAVMMLVAPALRVVPVTIHVPLRDVPAALTPDLLEQTLRITDRALREDFGLRTPKIAVAGLNPHAGEGGAMGDEEARVIAPVLDRLRAEGLRLTGPHSADTLFHAPARAGYDAAVCMYHDQALIPLKTLDFDGGVNVTLGLDFVRTSPDHGTAYDIAGQGRANPSSLMAALRMAHDLGVRRARQRS